MKLKTDDVLNDLTTYEDYKFNTILTDPPYNLGSNWIIDTDGTYQIKGKPQDFMNKWGALDGPALDTYFKESFRVLKYGGYMLMFGMDRQLGPLHYYAVKNGFEINQSLYWYFVSNFPKATDVSKMLDKRAGRVNNPLYKVKTKMKEFYKASKKTMKVIDEECEFRASGYLRIESREDDGWGEALPTVEKWKKIKEVIGCDDSLDDVFIEAEREVIGKGHAGFLENNKVFDIDNEGYGNYDITKAETTLAKVFDGYKYSKAPLKQMVETICVFSKPTKNKSVLDDIIEWSEDIDLLNYCPKVGKKERNMGLDNEPDKTGRIGNTYAGHQDTSKIGGNPDKQTLPVKNNHPCLKPINLIYEIAKLFKLPDIVNQKVYVPFSGSGSEVIGLLKAGYNHKNIYACEMNKEYVEISKKRIKHWYDTNKS